jgi:hypothetical protein
MDEPTSKRQTGREPLSAEIDLAPQPGNVKVARTFVATMLDLWECEDPEQVVELLTSEIVTNAIRHAQSDIRVIQPSSASREYGRGMMLVQQLAERWGVDKRSPSKAVWFEAIVLHRNP